MACSIYSKQWKNNKNSLAASSVNREQNQRSRCTPHRDHQPILDLRNPPKRDLKVGRQRWGILWGNPWSTEITICSDFISSNARKDALKNDIYYKSAVTFLLLSSYTDILHLLFVPAFVWDRQKSEKMYTKL